MYRNGKELRDKGLWGEAGRGILCSFMCICIKPVQSSHVRFLSHLKRNGTGFQKFKILKIETKVNANKPVKKNLVCPVSHNTPSNDLFSLIE